MQQPALVAGPLYGGGGLCPGVPRERNLSPVKRSAAYVKIKSAKKNSVSTMIALLTTNKWRFLTKTIGVEGSRVDPLAGRLLDCI